MIKLPKTNLLQLIRTRMTCLPSHLHPIKVNGQTKSMRLVNITYEYLDKQAKTLSDT